MEELKVETPTIKPAFTPKAAPLVIATENKVPGLWEMTSEGEGQIRAYHSLTGQTFVGEMSVFNAAMAH
jgi:hypothetical protein